MSHADHVTKIPKNFKKIASTKDSKYTIIENSKLQRFGVQFHPEFKSRPLAPHPLFSSFIKAAKIKSEK